MILINILLKKFNAELLFTDTDSLTYEIKSKNVYEEFFKWKDLFDLSNYSKDSKFFNETNEKVIGKMKDEFGGVIVSGFVGLKLKMYSIKKLMVKNIIQQKEIVLQLSLINSKMFYLIKNYQTQNEKNSK